MRVRETLQNPFEYGRELDAAELCDRTEELARIGRTADNRARLFLIGPRRYGKTSLLHAAQTQLAKRGVTVLRFDAERYESPDRLAEAMLRAATRLLRGPVAKARTMFLEAAKRLKPELSFDAATQEWNLSLGVTRVAAAPIPMLADVLDVIDRLAAVTKQPTLVIIDEFQQVVAEGGTDAERQLRAAVQQHRHVGYVFAGSATHLLSDMVTKRGRAFYRMGESLHLGALPRPAFEAYVRTRFTAYGLTITDDGLEALMSLGEEVPLAVQRLAHECWEQCRVAPRTRLDARAVQAVLNDVLARESPAYTRAWTSLTKAQKIALKTVVLEGGRALFSQDVAARSGLAVGTMQRALKALEQMQWVRTDDAAKPVRYRLDDPLFGAWVRWAQGWKAP